MEQPWNRPAYCDSWVLSTEYIGKSLIRRRDRYQTTAVGFVGEDTFVRYSGILGRCGYGHTREEAETKMRKTICADIKAYEGWDRRRARTTATYKKEDVCPC